MDDKLLIDQPISLLGLSRDFIEASRVMEFGTIKEILAIDPKELVAMEGFNYNWLCELVTFLNKHQLVHLLQPVPGKSHG